MVRMKYKAPISCDRHFPSDLLPQFLLRPGHLYSGYIPVEGQVPAVLLLEFNNIEAGRGLQWVHDPHPGFYQVGKNGIRITAAVHPKVDFGFIEEIA